jgi:UDP-N-acetylglucosamine transferase subunit ALG13
MIFVTVGTQPNGFLRCLKEVEALVKKYNIKEEVVAQIGNTKFESEIIKTIPFVGETEFKEYIKTASLVITHAGSGAIFSSIKAGKKVIAVARLHEYNEMADNHQTELVKKLTLDGYILDGTYSLSDAWLKAQNFVPRKNDFQNRIIDFLNHYIEDALSK